MDDHLHGHCSQGKHAGVPEYSIWGGDFNQHHLMWDKGQNSHFFTQANLDKAQALIDAAVELEIQMVFPKELPTLCAMSSGNYTRPYNVCTYNSLCVAITICKTVPEEQLALTTCQ